MEKHLLLTIGDDPKLLHGARFVASFFENRANIRLTLLFIATKSTSGGANTARQIPKQAGRPTDPCLTRGTEMLEVSRKLLVGRGFREDGIQTKLIDKRFGTVKDIVREGGEGLYDAVVLGRRGYAVLEKALSSSVSREILDQRINFPLWICRLPEEGRRNVLLCVDDTEPSMRIADHAGFIVAEESGHTITLLHVDSGETKNPTQAIERAEAQLLANGVQSERIKKRIIRSTKVVNTILEEAESGAYAAVAVGRGGKEQTGLRRWMVGSRSMKLVETLQKAVLWVSK